MQYKPPHDCSEFEAVDVLSFRGKQRPELSDDGWCGTESSQAVVMNLLTLRAGARVGRELNKGLR
jgi:hypothetical protein